MLRRSLLVLAVLLSGLAAGCTSATDPGGVPEIAIHSNVTYCHGQTLDLYIPWTDAGRRPVVLYVHGGGMTGGDKSDLNSVILDSLASAGYAVASVNYRLAPRYEFPAQIEDVTCAIRYLRAHAARFDVETRTFFAFGTSVGGELVALAALTGSTSTFAVGPYAGESSALTAVVDLYGPTDLTERTSGFTTADLAAVFGRATGSGPLLASPTHWVAHGAPPILIVQGVEDTKVRESQSIELYRDLKAADDPSQLVLVQHMGHMFLQVGPAPIDPSLGQIAEDVVRFFDRNGG